MQNPNPINIQAIDHVVIRAKDWHGMVRFYVDVLGCRLERVLDEIGLAQLRAGESLIDLVDANGSLGRSRGGPSQDATNMDHFCVRVVPWDHDAIVEHLEDHGVKVGEVASRYGARGQGPSIYIEDPERNMVELKGG